MGLGDIVGLVGAACILGAFAGVQLKKLDPHQLPALLLNLGGASLVIVSLIFKPNVAAFVLEAAWAAIAIGGLFGWLRRRQRRHGKRQEPARTPDV